jgi:hypothetical protein
MWNAESKMKADDRGYMTENKRQKTEDRRQMTEFV